MSLKNPETIDEIIEKLMISCVSASMELQRNIGNARTIQDIEEASREYSEYLKSAKEQALELIKHLNQKKRND